MSEKPEMACAASATPLDVDIPALRAKYRVERDRRIRPEGVRQYKEVTEDLSRYYEWDPYAEPENRAPIDDEVEVAILGGGFAGLLTAARLKQAGVTDIRIIEMAGDFGGTWYWNRYPGVQCDVESYTYLPLLEELGYMPRERYSYGPEIYEHCRRIGRHFDLYDNALFSTIVRDLNWDEGEERWCVTTDRGDDIRARFVVMCAGPLNKPKLPGIPGLSSFKGHTFHTARWDYDYTGGDTRGGLVKLADKRVAIIGTGATAVQCVPHLGRHAQHLYVFQRTPPYVDERGNRPTDPEWFASQAPGWQERRQRNFHAGVFHGVIAPSEDLICDGWGEISRNVAAKLQARADTPDAKELLALREVEDYRAMERIRRRIERVVEDPETAETLKPWYRFMCKRPCFNDDYLPTFNRRNVTLVDVSESRGVDRITENAVVVGDRSYSVDCIVFASGFDITDDLKRRFAIGNIAGRDGVSLYDHWRDGYQTLHGLTTRGFPNLFFTGYLQGATAAAINMMYDQQGSHISYLIAETLSRGFNVIEPTSNAQSDWVSKVRKSLITNPQFWHECTPGYYNNEGSKIVKSSHYGEPYGEGFFAFDDLLKEWRHDGRLEGMELR